AEQRGHQVGPHRVPRLGVLRLQGRRQHGRQGRRRGVRPVRDRRDPRRDPRRPDRQGPPVLLRFLRGADDLRLRRDRLGRRRGQRLRDPGRGHRAIDIATRLGMQPGSYGVAASNDLENKRYLAKIDWNINDNHRASLTYQQTEEFRISPYDEGARNVLLSSHYYNIDNITKNTSLQLFSDWSTNFSTEFKLSHQTFDQVNGNEVDNPEAIVRTPGGTIYI